VPIGKPRANDAHPDSTGRLTAFCCLVRRLGTIAGPAWSTEPSSWAADARSQGRGLLLGSDGGVRRDLVVLVVAAADRVPELPESLAESTTGVGQPLGSKEDERDDEYDDQVGRL